MRNKTFNLNLFVVIILITAIIAGWGIVYFGAKDTPYNYNSTHFSTTDCNIMHTQDSLAYADAEYVIDSLYHRTQELETQLAGCEFQDHSKLTEYATTK
jgi:hypothetical protein